MTGAMRGQAALLLLLLLLLLPPLLLASAVEDAERGAGVQPIRAQAATAGNAGRAETAHHTTAAPTHTGARHQASTGNLERHNMTLRAQGAKQCHPSGPCASAWMPSQVALEGATFVDEEGLARQYPFPFERQRFRCALAIIGAGTLHSGSALQMDIAQHAARVLVGLNRSLTLHHAGYWMPHVHGRTRANAEEYLDEMRAQVAGWTQWSVVLIKTHDYDPALFRLCERSVVLTTHRDPLEVLEAVLEEQGRESSEDMLPQLCRTLTHILDRHAAWSSVASVNAKYTEVTANLFSYVAEVFFVLARHMAPAVSKTQLIQALLQLWEDPTFFQSDSIKTLHDSSASAATAPPKPPAPSSASPTSAPARLKAEQAATLRCVSNAWRLAHGYGGSPPP